LRTRVAIVGAGPAGLALAVLLQRAGVDAAVVESRSREYVERRVRAGVLEYGSVELLDAIGVGDRLRREGLIHRGIALRFRGRSHRIDFDDLTGGKHVTVYGQQEVVKDLIAAVLRTDVPIFFNAEAVALTELDATTATLHYRDGFHGVSRDSVPAGSITLYEHAYPFCWLGVLAQSAPVSDELITRITSAASRLFRCARRRLRGCTSNARPATNSTRGRTTASGGSCGCGCTAAPADQPSAKGRFWKKGITPMRSFVAEPMRFGRLFLAGDAAHIVPPTGAKGMNLALADVRVLGRALEQFYKQGDAGGLDAYSQTCLRRVWKTQRFSAWMTGLLHRFDTYGAFERRLQLAELDYVTSSRAAARRLAENYVGLPFDESGPSLDDAGATSRP
jgi:p-hydroxybenzoate 3-monooxygenase